MTPLHTSRSARINDGNLLLLGSVYDICRTSTKKLLMGGNVSNNSVTDWDSFGSYTWLIQTDSLGCLEPGCAGADTIFNQSAIYSTKCST